jgi:hypothetical protein
MNQLIEKFARECGAWNQVYGNRNFMIDDVGASQAEGF